MNQIPSSNLYGLVDMGSNGIRFSITDLSPQTARSLPTVFQDREGISLYDAQYANIDNTSGASRGSSPSKSRSNSPTDTTSTAATATRQPIPQEIIDAVLASLMRFKTTCADFGVPDTNIRVLATEATRTAVNSEDYRRQIRERTGWEVDMLPKEAEGRIGAMGVASSFEKVGGLVMDLGGGSTQITWMVAEKGKVQTSPKGSFSFPYGAAAMTRQLEELEAAPHSNTARGELAAKMKQQFQDAYKALELPESLLYQADHGGLTLYLSGGGFRGWGYLLMSEHKITPYPIPIINGFTVSKYMFQQTQDVVGLAASKDSIFRVSKRRKAQVPAVAFLVNVLISALPCIKDIRFCQGGVREGFLYDTLGESVRSIDPLSSATGPYGTSSAQALAKLLVAALPGPNDLDRRVPESFRPALMQAIANMMFHLNPVPKETRSTSALYAPVTGVLSAAHGISHADRAILALSLCHRWAGDLAPPHGSLQDRLRAILTSQESWWCAYIGAIASLIGTVYPAGLVPDQLEKQRLQLSAKWADGLGKKGLDQGVAVIIRLRAGDPMTSPTVVNDAIDEVEKVGKKKNRIGGREHGFGIVVHVEIDRVQSF